MRFSFDTGNLKVRVVIPLWVGYNKSIDPPSLDVARRMLKSAGIVFSGGMA